jgi:transposase
MKKYFIGIDVSKETIDVSFVESDFQQQPEYLAQYPNGKKGYRSMIRDLKLALQGTSSGQWLFCCETTGAYDRQMCHWLVEHGMHVWRESALQIRQSLGIRRGKNDKADSMAIADYARRHPDKVNLFEIPSKVLSALKDLYLYRQTLVDKLKGVKNRQKALKSQGEAASPAARFIRRDSNNEIKRLERSIAECESAMMEVIRSDEQLMSNYEHVRSIKGFGLVVTVALMVYSGNFQTVPTANKMATYCGVASFRNKSGTTLDARQDVRHLSNLRLKGVLTMAARTAIRHDEAIRQYYQRKIAQGKQHGVAINNVKNKLLHIAYALVRDGQLYQSGHVANGDAA